MNTLEQLQLSFKNVDNSVFITSNENIILFVNQAFLEVEYKTNNIIGQNTSEISNLDTYTILPISQNKQITFYLYMQKSDENDSNSNYKNLYDNTPLPYQNLDKDGNFLNINKSWLVNLGYTREEIIGKSFSEFITKSSQDKFKINFPQFLSTGHVHDVEFDMIHKDKRIIPIRATGTIIYSSSSQVINTHCILQDIRTERKYKKQFSKSYEETIYSFIAINEQKDGYTAGHSQRVAFYASKIAQNLGMDEETINIVYKSGMLHDIGKIIVPESILLKPGNFNEIELQLMREHPQSGYDILHPISMYKEISDIIVHHHEHYDGSGYPFGKKGNEIPLISQVLAIADTFDAMTTNRIYKARKSVSMAIDELKSLSGIWFEPKLLNQAIDFLKTLPEVKQVNQLPKNEIEKQRFSYFFKDRLTDVYNGEYLNIHLVENNMTKEYECFNFIKIHNMGQYNSQYGWENGNKLLKSFTTKLLKLVNRDRKSVV